jgi:NAD(P)-dependent dehydrogenase (short-subunit alcohol dehydrogenase family)
VDISAGGRAVVTGAGRGIGLAIAQRLEREGMMVIRLDVTGDGVVPCDVADAAAVFAVAEQVGTVDVLVNVAGITQFGGLEEQSPADFARVLGVNLLGTFHCAQAFGRGMLAQRRGAIVNIASLAAIRVSSDVGAYSTSKAGIIALTQQMAVEWGPRGVRCNAVGPGLVVTEMTRRRHERPEDRDAHAGVIPLRRLGDVEDIANVVSFLVSDRASYITGQTIYVDGGLSHMLMDLFRQN